MPRFKPIAVAAAAVLLSLAVGAAAGVQPAPTIGWTFAPADLGPDPAVRYGVLPNGLRYAIQHNESPPGQVVMRLQILAGSMHEGPDQRGYAHILEHLAFRGSTHLADGEYAQKLAVLGAAFGADVNAFTTPTTTTFHIDLPKPDQAGVETGLSLLREVASELSLNPQTLNAERGVILAEERNTASVGRRAAYAANGFLYDGHPYALPVVGTVESIQSADVEGVRRFYDAYYRPERAVLVIVGDVDPGGVEAIIRAHFEDWHGRGQAGADPPPARLGAAPDRLFLYHEPGLAFDLRMVWPKPVDGPDSRALEIARIRESLALGVLSNRLADVAQSPNAPFRRAAVADQDIPGVASETYVDVSLINSWKLALQALYAPLRAALEAPIGQDEVDRAIAARWLRVSEAQARAATRGSGEIARGLLSDAALARVHQSPAQRRTLFDEAVRGLDEAQVEAILQARFGQEPLIVLTSPAEIPGGEESVKAEIARAKSLPLAAPAVEEAEAAWPFASFGPAGKVAERREAAQVGATFIRFENGVRLTVKPTPFRADEIMVNVRFGDGLMGWSRTQVQPERVLWPGLLLEGGLEGLTSRERNRFLTGKLVSLSVATSDDSVILAGQTRDQDLDVQMQLITADMTAAAWRPDDFDQLKRQEISQLLGRGPPQTAFRNREASLFRSGDPRWTNPSAVQVASASYEATRAFGKAMMAKGPIEVIIVGDVTVDRAIEVTAATLGALPARTGTALDADARRVTFPAAPAAPVTLFHSGRPDQGLIIVAWPTTDFFGDQKAAATLDVLREIMRQRLLKQLRATMGETYSPSVTSQTSLTSPGFGVISVRVEVPPDKMALAFRTIDDIAQDLADKPVSVEEFASAANPYVESVNRRMRTNSFWAGWLAGAQSDPRRIEAASTMLERARAVTAQDVYKAAQTWLVKSRAWRGRIVPDPAMLPPPGPQAERTQASTP
jgi:zinc protease